MSREMTNSEAISNLNHIYGIVSPDIQRSLDVAIEALEERPQDKWTPVSEGLPKQANKAYLVTIDYGDGVAFSCQRFFFGKGIGWNDSGVLAWMPLPEPYKKGGAK